MFGEKKRLDGYVVETVEHNGKPKDVAVYIGNLLAYDSPRFAMRVKIFLCFVGFYLAAAFLVCGFSAFNNNVAYVLIPYVLQAVTVVLYAMSVINLMLYGVLVKEVDIGKSSGRIKPICIAHAVFSVIAAVGDVFFIAFDPAFSSMAYESSFIAFNVLSAVAALFGAFAVKLLSFHEVENPEKGRIDKKREEQKQFDLLLELERKEKIKQQSREANEARKKNKRKKK